jgi:Ni,Fe-hydrogenase III large subunit/NADH:ubiquinone oxidoreductase subunit C
MSKSLDIIGLMESKFGDKISVERGKLEAAAITANNGMHYEVLKAMIAADEKTGITSITGLDLGQNLGIYYHVHTSKPFVTIKTEVPKTNPTIKSVIDIHTGALFHELEVTDLVGVVFEGNPSGGHFVLPETWPMGVYPLRKDFKATEVKKIPVPTYEENTLPENQRQVKIIIGPQHPALLEPEKFSVTVEGETVIRVDPRIGYVHRGIEKSAESRTYLQDVYLVERVCGICNPCHAYGFVGATEKILKTPVPERAKYLRVIALELNRIHSHMLTLGHACLEIGYETIFQYFWRDREPIMDLIELTSGNRVYGSQITIGGVRRDLTATEIPKIREGMKNLRNQLPFYYKVYREEPSIRLRMSEVGVMSREDAIKLACVGPVARGSKYDTDIRKDIPYEAYGDIPFKEIVYESGDVWARMNVRLDEVEESINIIEYALDHLPSGPFKIEQPRTVPVGDAVCSLEAPRGELFYYVKGNGTDMPDRVKIRTPTFANIPSFLKSAIGESIADVPSNFVSLDPCFSCTDR